MCIMTYIDVTIKLKCVLYKFSDSNFKFSGSDDVYLQKLTSLLISQGNVWTGDGDAQERRQLCAEWLEHVAHAWAGAPPHPGVAALALRLAGVVAGDPRGFARLRGSGTLDRLAGCLGPQVDCDGPVTLAYLSLLSGLLGHDEGCRWITDTDVWRAVIRRALESRSARVRGDSHEVVARLVARLQARGDLGRCRGILNHALVLLELAAVNSRGAAPREDDEALAQAAAPLLCRALEAASLGCPATATATLPTHHDPEQLAWQLVRLLDDEAGLPRFLRLLVLLYFVLFRQMSASGGSPAAHAACFKAKLFTVISYLVSKSYVNSILYVAFECQLYFHRFGMGGVEFEDGPKLCELKDQLLLFLVCPILFYEREYNTSNDLFLSDFIQKLFDKACEDAVRLGYALKDVCLADESMSPEYAKRAIVYLLQLQDCLDKEQVSVVCQSLIHALKTFARRPPEEHSAQSHGELSHILDALARLLDRFQISCRDTLECADLFSHVATLLRNPLLPPHVAVRALGLMQVAVRNHLPPNLALLVDTVSGSSLQELGPLMQRRLHDPSWDVRDSTLELLRTVTEVSRAGFPSFQELVLESGLCELALAAAAGDGESYVRASALKCLGTMVRVPRLWDACLASRELPSMMVSILGEESEGLVRTEAARLMTELYCLHGASQGRVFAAMAAAATSDLYWEVKLGALCFWEKVIEQRLGDQGMIDGRFPAVTFSREDRKIVTLTEGEVRARIGRALEELGRLGCLQVLLSAVHDCDLEVARKAAAVAASLSSLLAHHGLLPASEHGQARPARREETQRVARAPGGSVTGTLHASDRVIEGIVRESDVDLLSRVFADRASVAAVAPMAARDFLSALGAVDLRQLVSERARWLDDCGEGLGCLLDDILLAHGDPGDFVADCY
ncbi:uncharacterized protein LOC134541035 isoform X2 [Bacillus rossius redtenbacheri]|uniref:uncharacterized protein LOC134541035 isoform X2 n=1 Tax=Bacillus rossius redtenbacheri TaxID=93214 RepID=UPI002FDD17B3